MSPAGSHNQFAAGGIALFKNTPHHAEIQSGQAFHRIKSYVGDCFEGLHPGLVRAPELFGYLIHTKFLFRKLFLLTGSRMAAGKVRIAALQYPVI